MPLRRDRAVCLRKFEYSETSQILTLFGRRGGLVRVIAKGAHRRTKAGHSKFDGGVDLLDYGDCNWVEHTNRELSTLTEWKLLDGQLALRRSLRGMMLGQTLAEVLTLIMPEHEANIELWTRFVATLRMLMTPIAEAHLIAFLLDAIAEAGILPEEQNLSDANGQVLDPALARVAAIIRRLPRERGLAQRLPVLTRRQTDPLISTLLTQVERFAQRPIRLRPFILP